MQSRIAVKTGRPQYSGFTLIELVAVIVILSILAVVGGGFMVRSAESYQQTVGRGQLVQQGRQAIERITRELRIAVPNSIRVSSNNLCVEWLPVVGGVNYLGELPDQSNGAIPADPQIIETAPVTIGLGASRYVTVGALSSTELYGATPASLALFSSLDDSTIPNEITLGSPKQFQRNSVSGRLFIADHPKQICIEGGRLTLHENYTAAGSYPSNGSFDGSPPSAGVLLSLGVNPTGEVPFTIEGGTEARNTIVDLELPFVKNGERLVLRHQVMVRNVP